MFGQSLGSPPTSTVAVKGWFPNPVLSTVIDTVPCPSMIFPADTVQLKVILVEGLMFAVNLRVEPLLVSGQFTENGGHKASACARACCGPTAITKSNKSKEE